MKKAPSIHLNTVAVAAASEALTQLSNQARSLKYAVAITDDGFELAHWPTSRNASNTMASMVSSIQALGEAVARELDMGAGKYVVLAVDEGQMVQLRVPGQHIVVGAVFDALENLGVALRLSTMAAESLGAVIPADLELVTGDSG